MIRISTRYNHDPRHWRFARTLPHRGPAIFVATPPEVDVDWLVGLTFGVIAVCVLVGVVV